MNTAEQRPSWESYLQKAQAHQNETGGGEAALFDALREFFDKTTESRTAAAYIASFVFSNEDILYAYENVLGYCSCIIGAARVIIEEEYLGKLAELVLSLSQLPDARNESQETLLLQNNSARLVVKPGELFKINDSRIWVDLPLFGVNLCDSLYGPSAYISDGLTEIVAEQRWLSLNTFAAYLIRGSDKSKCSFGYLFHYAFLTLAQALEFDPTAIDGAEALLHLTSACRWVTIAGSELLKRTATETQYAVAGPIWTAKGGTDLICQARWTVWANRLCFLCQSKMIPDEGKLMARQSAQKIRAYQDREDGTGS